MIGRSGRAWLRDAFEQHYALPAFNVSNMECVQGVIAAAEETGSPIILQVSPGVISYAGYDTITSIVERAAADSYTPVILHLDHCRDPELVRRALADGYGSVMFDGSNLPFGENVDITAALCAEAHAVDSAFEGELGAIGGVENSTLDSARRNAAAPDECQRFVELTDVDVLAPAIGNLHRMPDDSFSVDVGLIRSITEACRRPLALHGASGVKRAGLPAAVAAGIGKINVSSRVGRAFARGIRECWDIDPGQSDLRRFLGAGREQVRRLALEYIGLAGSSERARVQRAETPTWTANGAEAE